jgi:cation transport ATPase
VIDWLIFSDSQDYDMDEIAYSRLLLVVAEQAKQLDAHESRLTAMEGLHTAAMAAAADEIKRKRDGANLAVFVTLFFSVTSLVTIVVCARGIDAHLNVWELMSYLFPSLAAVFAGLTAYVKSFETAFFWSSSVFVLLGVIAFFIFKVVTATLMWNWIFAYGFSVSVFIGPYFLFFRRPETRKSGLTIFATVVAVLLLLGGVVFNLYERQGVPTQGFINLMHWLKCKLPGMKCGN